MAIAGLGFENSESWMMHTHKNTSAGAWTFISEQFCPVTGICKEQSNRQRRRMDEFDPEEEGRRRGNPTKTPPPPLLFTFSLLSADARSVGGPRPAIFAANCEQNKSRHEGGGEGKNENSSSTNGGGGGVVDEHKCDPSNSNPSIRPPFVPSAFLFCCGWLVLLLFTTLLRVNERKNGRQTTNGEEIVDERIYCGHLACL